MKFDTLPPLVMLHAFAVFARTHSIEKTSEAMGVGITQIKQYFVGLEAQLGKKLFIRDQQKIDLNAEGRTLAETLITGFQHIAEGVNTTKGLVSFDPLTVSAPAILAIELLTPLVSSFQRIHSNANISVRHLDFETPKVLGEGQLVISEKNMAIPETRSRYLFSSSLCLVATRDVVVKFKDVGLRQVPLISEVGDSRAANWLSGGDFLANHVGGVETLPEHQLLPALLANQGMAVVEYAAVKEHIKRKRLLVLQDFGETMDYYISVPNQVPTPQMSEFMAWLSNSLLPSQVAENTPNKTGSGNATNRKVS
jgi:DNA-binding transcriptional LysR family regulator